MVVVFVVVEPVGEVLRVVELGDVTVGLIDLIVEMPDDVEGDADKPRDIVPKLPLEAAPPDLPPADELAAWPALTLAARTSALQPVAK